jgi:hypothetical protein
LWGDVPRPPRIALTLCALLVAAALPPAAEASRSQTMTFEAPVDLVDGARRDAALDEIGSLGVRSVRVVLYWRDVAPAALSRVKPAFDESSPASYGWGAYEAMVAGAKARGWEVLLTLSGPVPRWATNGARDTLTRPSPSEFAKFAEAAGRQFGTRVDRWSIWNEPNQPQFLLPQYSRRGHRPLSPALYRSLYLAGRRGLRAAGLGSAPVLVAETSPRGTGKVVAPLTFLRGMLCLDSRYRRARRCGPLDADGYAHHAYTTGQGPFFRPPGANDVTIGVLSRLVRALDRAARAGAIRPRIPIHLTEFGIESVPDPLRGVSLAKQHEYRSISERLAWENRRVVAFSQYLLRDSPPDFGAPRIARYPGFESGLRTYDGKAKPSLAGFPLPLAALRRGSSVSLWGLVRPAGGRTTATVEQRVGRRWRRLATVTTDARGYFTRSTPLRAGRRYRLVWTSPSGTVLRSPAVRVYRRG